MSMESHFFISTPFISLPSSVLRVKLSLSCMLGKGFTTRLHPCPSFFISDGSMNLGKESALCHPEQPHP